MNTVKLSRITLAAAAATLLLAGCGGDKAAKIEAPAATKVAEIKFSGINSCKGQGWIKATKADCEAKGGKVLS